MTEAGRDHGVLVTGVLSSEDQMAGWGLHITAITAELLLFEEHTLLEPSLPSVQLKTELTSANIQICSVRRVRNTEIIIARRYLSAIESYVY